MMTKNMIVSDSEMSINETTFTLNNYTMVDFFIISKTKKYGIVRCFIVYFFRKRNILWALLIK